MPSGFAQKLNKNGYYPEKKLGLKVSQQTALMDNIFNFLYREKASISGSFNS